MTKVIMHGCNGRMGRVIANLIKEEENVELVAGIDTKADESRDFPVFTKIEDCNVKADVIIDFASAAAVDALLEYCEEKEMPCVLCTTGLSDQQLVQVEAVSNQVAILKSANMSLGINLLEKLIHDATEVLSEAGFDIEIVEKHHRRKLDAPSGTALALGEAARGALKDDCEFVFDRSERREQRPKNEIGISAVRGGTIVGEHDIIFAGEDEVITLSHVAYSRAIFGKGAVQAAKYLAGKQAGLYSMKDVIEK